jgi:competence protein ComEA
MRGVSMKEYFMKLSKNQRILIIAILVIILIVFLILHGIFYSNNNEFVVTNEINDVSSDGKWEKISSNSYAKKDGKIVINVVGEVNNPGVVTLDEGARIIDAINAAGGKTEKADISEINLAYVLEDGSRLYIPSFSEMKEKKLENSTNSKDIISSDTGVSNIVMEEVNVEKKNTNEIKKININKASKDELKQLSGVGDSVAQAIIDYRQKNGKFNSIEDIKKVPGIGESKFHNIEKMISVK